MPEKQENHPNIRTIPSHQPLQIKQILQTETFVKYGADYE